MRLSRISLQADSSLASARYEDEVDKQDAALSVYRAKADELCYLPYTSGSTGNPKGCMLTHAGQLWNVRSTSEVRGITNADRILIAVPLYHKNGMAEMKKIFFLGASAVILPKVDVVDILEAVHRHRCTFMTGVPAMYRSIVNHLREHNDYNLSSLRFVVCGSSDAPKELLDEMNARMGTDVYEGYGLTEGGRLSLVRAKVQQSLAQLDCPYQAAAFRLWMMKATNFR